MVFFAVWCSLIGSPDFTPRYPNRCCIMICFGRASGPHAPKLRACNQEHLRP